MIAFFPCSVYTPHTGNRDSRMKRRDSLILMLFTSLNREMWTLRASRLSFTHRHAKQAATYSSHHQHCTCCHMQYITQSNNQNNNNNSEKINVDKDNMTKVYMLQQKHYNSLLSHLRIRKYLNTRISFKYFIIILNKS